MKLSRPTLALILLGSIVFGRVVFPNEVVRHSQQRPKVLNNFVTQLVDASELTENSIHEFTIEWPRTGWLFFRATAWAGRSGTVRMTLRRVGAPETTQPLAVMTYEAGEKGTRESMHHVRDGTHTLRVELEDAEMNSLDVRRIPIIIYERVPGSFRAMGGYPEYDREFLRRCGMLDACNTIGTYDGFLWMQEWQRTGRHAIRIAGGFSRWKTPERTYEFFRSAIVNPSGVNGMIVDEFYPGQKEKFPLYVDILKRVQEDVPDRVCYVYLAGSGESMRSFVEPLKDTRTFFVLEEQVYERRTLAELQEMGFGKNWVKQFSDYLPNFSERCIHSVGVFSGPNGRKYNDDVYPSVSYKTLKELHFYELATDPLHAGVGGVEIYQSTLCDEEYLRWCAKLFRHYAIEGSQVRLSNDPYELNHLDNPDFEDGLEGWTVDAALPGTVDVREIKDYGMKVQGRHGHVGDHFVWMKRHADKPNVISQEIKNLEPGRHYSIRMYTGDYQNMTQWQIHNVSVQLRGSEIIPSQTIQNAWEHQAEKEFGPKPMYPNYHRYVFKAVTSTAMLMISDWHSPTIPSAPVGQELTFNFIQVEPYLMP